MIIIFGTKIWKFYFGQPEHSDPFCAAANTSQITTNSNEHDRSVKRGGKISSASLDLMDFRESHDDVNDTDRGYTLLSEI